MKKYLDTKNLDVKTSPNKDFYQYAVGGWLKKNKIPDDKARWSTFDKLRVDNEKKLKGLIGELTKKKTCDEHEGCVKDFYASGMHRNRNQKGFAPLAELLAEVGEVSTEEEYMKMVAKTHVLGVSVWWSVFIEPDEKKSDTLALYLYQGGLTLPDRDYYLSRDASHAKVRTAYTKYFAVMGDHYEQAQVGSFEKDVVRIEKYLATASRTRAEVRDVHKQYNKSTITKLKKAHKDIMWDTYMEGIGAKINYAIVGQPEYFVSVQNAMRKFSLTTKKRYLAWRILTSFAPYLSEEIYEQHFAFFGKVLTGVEKIQPRWKRVLQAIDGTIGESLGQMFVDEYFPPRAHKKVEEIAKNIKDTFHKRIAENTWMHSTTKKKAQHKLKTMRIKIGHPKKYEQYRGLEIVEDDFFGNILRVRQWENKKEMRRLGKKPNRAKWEMTPHTVNAYYHPLLNEMVFPAGILQPPFFSLDHDDAMNYGGFGTVIAHEITHGFDDQGSLFDEKGNIKNWWRKADREKFESLTKKVIDQFDAFTPLPKVHVNGALTVGENIADLGGLMIALDAYESTCTTANRKGRDGHTGVQRFFLSYALTEAGAMRDKEQRRLIIIDPHSPGKFRVMGPLSHMDRFYDVFDIDPKNKFYRAPEDRVTVW